MSKLEELENLEQELIDLKEKLDDVFYDILKTEEAIDKLKFEILHGEKDYIHGDRFDNK